MAVRARRWVPTFSLRAHLLIVVFGTLLPTLLVAAFLVRRVVADNREAVEQRLLQATRAEAALVDAELGGTIRALQAAAQSDHLLDGDLQAFYAQALRLLATQPTWSAVTLATVEGRQIVNTSRPFGEALPIVTDRESFQHAVESKTPTTGNLRAGQISGELGFPVRVPVIRDGRVLYIVSAWITSTGFASVLKVEPSVSDEWVRGVVDANGVIVARSRDAERYVGQKGTPAFLNRYQTTDQAIFRDVALDGTAVYSAYTRAPVSGWIAGVGVPAAAVDAPFRQSMIALAAVALVLVGVGAGGTYLMSRRIARDISKSAEEAEAIAGGRGLSQARARVTEIQRLLDALARSAALLETRQRERDEEVARADAARAVAEAADQAKDEFLAMLGHELRNPLAPALTAIHLMKVRGVANETRERDVLERQIQHMARLVDDLLDVSRLRRGAIELRRERFVLSEAVARAVEMTAPLFSEKRHALDVDVAEALTIDADRIRIAQVLSNLLSNAAKYTEAGGRIALRAQAENRWIVIECRDNGIGMTPDLVPRVFDLFVQGQRGRDRRQGGLGLGLAVARTLVELHGGTIEAASAGTNRGSTFTVRLPAARPAVRGRAHGDANVDASNAAAPSRPESVMVVDDNRDALEMLLEALREAGHEAFGASTSAEALDLAARRRPHVAVLDIGLPEVDGFGLARALRSQPYAPRLIALTGYGREQDMAAAREAGFDAFFVKPVDIAMLLDAVAQTEQRGA
jgi:signal transduction histidine kinase/CheY-like chemotaxis protein